jgi:hypothetical protein
VFFFEKIDAAVWIKEKHRCIFAHAFRKRARSLHGVVAQLVEHRTENPGVAGSIPARTTIFYLMITVFAHTHHHHGLPS